MSCCCWWCPSLIPRFCDIDSPEAGHFYRQRRYRGPRVSCTDGAQAMLVVEGFTSGIALQTPEDPRRQSKTCIWMPASQHQKWPTIQRIVSFIFDIWFGPDCPTRVYLPPLRLKFERLEQWMVSVWQEFLCCLSCIQLPAIARRKSLKAFSVHWISFGRVMIGYDMIHHTWSQPLDIWWPRQAGPLDSPNYANAVGALVRHETCSNWICPCKLTGLLGRLPPSRCCSYCFPATLVCPTCICYLLLFFDIDVHIMHTTLCKKVYD